MLNSCGTTLTDASGKSVQVTTLSCIFPLMANIISWLLQFSGIVAVVLIIYAGIRLISSGGDPKQIEGAKKILTYAIMGLVLIFLSFAILTFIADITGVACIDPNEIMSFTSCK